MNILRWPNRQLQHFSPYRKNLVFILLALSIFISACGNTDDELRFEIKASEIITATENPFINIDSLTLSEEYLYVSDIHHIKVFDLQGHYVKSIGKQGHAEGQFAGEVIGLAINSRKELLAVDMQNQRVQVFDQQDKVIRTFGQHGEQGDDEQDAGEEIDDEDAV